MPVSTEFLNNTCLQNRLFPKDEAWSGFKSHSSSSVDELSIGSTDFDPYIKLLLVWGCWSPGGWHCNLLQWPPSSGSVCHYHITAGCLLSLLWVRRIHARVLPHSDTQSSLLEVLPFSFLLNYFIPLFVSLGTKILSKHPFQFSFIIGYRKIASQRHVECVS